MLTLIGLVIALASVFVGWQQKRIADIRLQHDLYDRRFKVYAAAKALLIIHQTNAKISGEDYFEFLRGISDAEFLLDDSVLKYLKEIKGKAQHLMFLQDKIKESTIDQDLREKLVNEWAEISKWFPQQFGILIDRFKPSMQLDTHYWRRLAQKTQSLIQSLRIEKPNAA